MWSSDYHRAADRRGSCDGTLDRIHHGLYVACREQAECEASPTAAIIDIQSVKSAGAPTPAATLPSATRSRGYEKARWRSASLASTVACSAWFHAAVHAAPFALRAAPFAAPCALCAVPDAVPCALSAVPDAVACRSAEWLPCRSVYWAAGPQHLIPLGPSERRLNLMRPVPTTKRPFDARSFGSHSVRSRPNLPI
jgi:hypothetical protein